MNIRSLVVNRAKRRRPVRTYRSEVRKESAARTAERILDGVGEVLLKSGTVSYSAIARAARVSIPTVYRHFPRQDDLFLAIANREQSRVHTAPIVADREALPEYARTFFARFDDPEDVFQHRPRATTVWEFSRVATVPRRRALIEAILAREAPGVPEPERTWIVDLGIVLFSSTLGEAFRGYLGLSGAEMAERVSFAMEMLLADARKRARKPRTASPRRKKR